MSDGKLLGHSRLQFRSAYPPGCSPHTRANRRRLQRDWSAQAEYLQEVRRKKNEERNREKRALSGNLCPRCGEMIERGYRVVLDSEYPREVCERCFSVWRMRQVQEGARMEEKKTKERPRGYRIRCLRCSWTEETRTRNPRGGWTCPRDARHPVIAEPF